MIRVLVVDDHPIVVQGIRHILSEEADIVVASEAHSGQEALEKARKGGLDIILLDIALPGRKGLEVLAQLRSEHPKLPVLILSMYPEEDYAVRSLKAGASGYLNKARAPADLIGAIRRIAGGRKFISESLGEHLASFIGGDSKKPLHEELTDREFMVLQMIASGMTITEISRELSLSVKTVSTYRTRLLAKMRMKNNADIIHYGIAHNLLGSE
jgi:DNA-binding NarL/FixJ family response regulator